MTLARVTLGDGLVVSSQGFGTMGLTGTYGEVDHDEALATLGHAVEVGVTHLDTADVYGRGEAERLVGELLAARGAARRDEVEVATKFGILPEADAAGLRVRGDAAYVRASIDASLARLGTDHVDLYYYHRLDPRVPIEETVGALAELVVAGKVRHVGLSEVTAAELTRAQPVHPIAAVQSEWSIWSRDVETHVVPTAARLGVGFVAYAPIGRGFLAGAASGGLAAGDLRRGFPRFDDERLAENQSVADAVAALAGEVAVTPAQLAIAWVHAQAARLGVAVSPIPGTRRAARVDENVAAAAITLEPAVLERLDALAARVAGDRARDPGWTSQGRERAG